MFQEIANYTKQYIDESDESDWDIEDALTHGLAVWLHTEMKDSNFQNTEKLLNVSKLTIQYIKELYKVSQ